MNTGSYNTLWMGWILSEIPTPYIMGGYCCMSPTRVLFAVLYLSHPSLASPTSIPKHDCPQDIEYTSPPPYVSTQVVLVPTKRIPSGNECRGLFRRQQSTTKPLNLLPPTPPPPHSCLASRWCRTSFHQLIHNDGRRLRPRLGPCGVRCRMGGLSHKRFFVFVCDFDKTPKP